MAALHYLLKNRAFLVTVVVLTIGLCFIVAAPFIGIWGSWELALKVGLTGVAIIVAPIVAMGIGYTLWALVRKKR